MMSDEVRIIYVRPGRAPSANPPPPRPRRDQEKSPFSIILEELIERIHGAYAAALVDQEGESVDYAGSIPPFDIKIAAASWRITLAHLEAVRGIGKAGFISIRTTSQTISLYALPDGYALVVLMRPRVGLAGTARAFSACAYALANEAGWQLTSEIAPWFPVTVDCDTRNRPIRIVYGGLAEPVEVLGILSGTQSRLTRRERGFRIRLASGPEITVVREATGHWYAEERFG
ncbi:hypothetical protein LVJ94_47580 [Pendulispora rubella]|uniref:Uncharacterized protein n=1 Tax=Pendulispora rubella TaxID=2741070 RepID=A0ABZ2L0T9_9BACT